MMSKWREVLKCFTERIPGLDGIVFSATIHNFNVYEPAMQSKCDIVKKKLTEIRLYINW